MVIAGIQIPKDYHRHGKQEEQYRLDAGELEHVGQQIRNRRQMKIIRDEDER